MRSRDFKRQASIEQDSPNRRFPLEDVEHRAEVHMEARRQLARDLGSTNPSFHHLPSLDFARIVPTLHKGIRFTSPYAKEHPYSFENPSLQIPPTPHGVPLDCCEPLSTKMQRLYPKASQASISFTITAYSKNHTFTCRKRETLHTMPAGTRKNHAETLGGLGCDVQGLEQGAFPLASNCESCL